MFNFYGLHLNAFFMLFMNLYSQEKDVRIILGNFGEEWGRKIFCQVNMIQSFISQTCEKILSSNQVFYSIDYFSV
jgi:hypothetical protein